MKGRQQKQIAEIKTELKRKGFELLFLPTLNRIENGVLYVLGVAIEGLKPGQMEVHHLLVINEATCCDCGGQVESYNIPNVAWNGLGFEADDFACLDCVARRLNPQKPADSPERLAKQIDKRFPSKECGLVLSTLGNAEAGRRYKIGVNLQATSSKQFTVSVLPYSPKT